MDRLIYTAMTGAKQVFEQQAGVANNLANVSTTAFKAQEHRFFSVPLTSEAMPTRAFVADASSSTRFSPGSVITTGNPLDVAVQGKGWLTVQMPDGSEAYTRAGDLEIDPNGVMRTKEGHPLLGTQGLIVAPPGNRLEIGSDGGVSVTPSATGGNVLTVGRLKLVNPPESDLVRGEDGLFRRKGGATTASDPNVRLLSGSLEGSNVNPTEAMVSLISLARQFEMQVKLLQTADANAKQADQILSLNG